MVLKPDIVHKCSTITELKNIYLTNKDNFLKAKDINLGFSARQCMTNLKKSDLISKKSLVSYMNECIKSGSGVVREENETDSVHVIALM